MTEAFRTIAHAGHGFYEEKKSRFLGEARPVQSQEEVSSILEDIRKETYDARHHCYAFVIGAERTQKRSSDDGEPSGTAGAPILKVLESAGCTNVLLVVTRYFGGTLLGTGGLVRAYTSAASLALEDAGIVVMQAGMVLHVTMPYRLYDRVLYQLRQRQLEPAHAGFGTEVSFDLTVPKTQYGEIEAFLAGAGREGLRMEVTGQGYYAFPDVS